MTAEHIEQVILSGVDRSIILELIMDEYGTKIKRFIYSYVKDWDISRDLTQGVFVTIFQKLDTFQQRPSFKTWIYTIALNKCKDYMKSWHYRNMVMNEKILFFKKDNRHTPEEQVLREDISNDPLQSILSLPIKFREVLLLHYYQELSLQEVSIMLNISISTVRSRLYRGQEKVRKIYLQKERGEQHG